MGVDWEEVGGGNTRVAGRMVRRVFGVLLVARTVKL